MSIWNEEALARLEHSWLEPPTDNAPLCSCCGLPADDVYFISDTVYCEDCAKDLHRAWVLDETITCAGCDEEVTDEYYSVGNENYCLSCFERYFKD